MKLLGCPPLTSCYAAWFVTGHQRILVHGWGAGDPGTGCWLGLWLGDQLAGLVSGWVAGLLVDQVAGLVAPWVSDQVAVWLHALQTDWRVPLTSSCFVPLAFLPRLSQTQWSHI